MNAQTQTTDNGTHYSTRKARLMLVLAIALGVPIGQSPAADHEPGNYDENILFSPSKAVLLAEQKGRVTIYDGLARHLSPASRVTPDVNPSALSYSTRFFLPVTRAAAAAAFDAGR